MNQLYSRALEYHILCSSTLGCKYTNKTRWMVVRAHPQGLVERWLDVELELEQVAKQLHPSSHAQNSPCFAPSLPYTQATPNPLTTMSTDPRRRAQPPPPPPPPEDVPDTTTMGLDGTTDPSQTIATNGQPQAPAKQSDDGFKLKFCTVCASNNNRYAPPLPPSHHQNPNN